MIYNLKDILFNDDKFAECINTVGGNTENKYICFINNNYSFHEHVFLNNLEYNTDKIMKEIMRLLHEKFKITPCKNHKVYLSALSMLQIDIQVDNFSKQNIK